ncbi:hypothetical protein EJB05_07439, partial [Eragrostis curvula]
MEWEVFDLLPVPGQTAKLPRSDRCLSAAAVVSSSSSAMIQAVMVISTQAKPRLLKFYNFQPPEKHQDLVRGIFQLLSARPDSVSNFVGVDAIFGPVMVNLLVNLNAKETNGMQMLVSGKEKSGLNCPAAIVLSGFSHTALYLSHLSDFFALCRERKWSISIWLHYTSSLSLIALRTNSLCLISYKFLLKHWTDASEMYASWTLYLTSISALKFTFTTSRSCLAHCKSMQLHTVLDEMILGGQVIETSSEQIMKSVEEIARLEKQSSTTSLIPKSISERFSR